MSDCRILLADDQLLVRAGIRALLENLPGYCVISECSDGHETLAGIEHCKPDVALLDIAMPGPSGIEVTRLVRAHDQDLPILILSSIDRKEVVEEAIDAGINGYLLKDFLLEDLQQALNDVLQGIFFISPRIDPLNRSDGCNGNNALEQLTVRQLEILRLVASGKTSKEIARKLGISPKTVEFHRARLFQRVGVNDITGLTRFAVQNGLIS